MKILITGTAGFIGTHLLLALHKQGHTIWGIDNINNFSDAKIKWDRLQYQGIDISTIKENEVCHSSLLSKYYFVQQDLADINKLEALFKQENFDVVCNLAAQAGVRASIDHPDIYIKSNLIGFYNILECCRRYPVKHLLYASSSSVYGANNKTPYSEADKTDNPVSLYAATKKSNELLAYSYSHLYNIRATGLRFFTVYGPWGRTNMAPFIFMRSIHENTPIQIFNDGDLYRDFTFIDDIIEGILHIINCPQPNRSPHEVYNIGNSSPVHLIEFIHTIEKVMNKEAIKEYMPMQAGDVYITYADTKKLQTDFNYAPSTSLSEGITKMFNWFISYYETK